MSSSTSIVLFYNIRNPSSMSMLNALLNLVCLTPKWFPMIDLYGDIVILGRWTIRGHCYSRRNSLLVRDTEEKEGEERAQCGFEARRRCPFGIGDAFRGGAVGRGGRAAAGGGERATEQGAGARGEGRGAGDVARVAGQL